MNSDKLHNELGKMEDAISVRTGEIKATLKAARELIIEHRELRTMLEQAADPSCSGCDGTGIFMGNVTICACVNSHLAKLQEDDDEL